MIQANELRIGNWVNDAYGRTGTVKGIKNYTRVQLKMAHSTHECEDDQINPIPLTPSILTDWCGFEVTKYHRSIYRKGASRIWFRNGIFTDGHYGEIDGLHTLQNIFYFQNYGTELEIKIPEKA